MPHVGIKSHLFHAPQKIKARMKNLKLCTIKISSFFDRIFYGRQLFSGIFGVRLTGIHNLSNLRRERKMVDDFGVFFFALTDESKNTIKLAEWRYIEVRRDEERFLPTG